MIEVATAKHERHAAQYVPRLQASFCVLIPVQSKHKGGDVPPPGHCLLVYKFRVVINCEPELNVHLCEGTCTSPETVDACLHRTGRTWWTQCRKVHISSMVSR